MELSEAGNSQQDGGSSDQQLLLYHLLDRVARVNSEEDDNQFTDDFALVRCVLQRHYNLMGL